MRGTMGGMVVVLVMLSYVCVYSYLAALFPSWPMRWGTRGKGPPMSTAGRITFGTISGYLVVLPMVHLALKRHCQWD